jgi:hypothetical protein
MAINGISGSVHSFDPSSTKSKADESIEQLAAEGDPIAIAELKAEEPQQNPAQAGASEPGKGQQIDKYV